MELCDKLKQIRKENNLTQQQLADELCLSRTVITKFESGYKIPNLNTLTLISNYFNTDIFDDYKNRFKLFILSLKCLLPYLLSFLILLTSSLCLVSNVIKVNNQYGYNIYNDELKVKNSDEILIIKIIFKENYSYSSLKYKCNDLTYLENKLPITLGVRYLYLSNALGEKSEYNLIFINSCCNLNNQKMYENIIHHKPFIYPLEDYDESLPYNEQTGECRKILNYYINLIEKEK